MKKILISILTILVVYTTATAQDKLPQKDYLGDYYLFGWGHKNYNLNSLNIDIPDLNVHHGRIGSTYTGSIGIGWRIFKNDYITVEVGRFNSNWTFDTPYIPYATRSIYGGGRNMVPGIRAGYERIIPLSKRFYFVPNLGIKTIFINNGFIEGVWPTLDADMRSKGEAHVGLSLALNMEYRFWKRYTFFLRAQADYYITQSNSLQTINFYYKGLDDRAFQISILPVTSNIGLGLKISLEGKGYFK